MKRSILVLTHTEDGIHSDLVISKLRECGEKVFRMDVNRLADGSLRAYFFTDSCSTGFKFQDREGDIASGEIKSIWYRRPDYFDLTIRDPIQRVHVEKELQSFLGGLWALVPEDVFWFSEPGALERAKKKIYQLEIARTLGLSIPETIVSNDPAEVIDFYETHQGKIIFKTLSHEFLDYGDKGFIIPTTLITPSHLARLGLLRKSPGFFQRLIQKKYELRITVVGDRIFPVKINSQGIPLAMVDWRNPVCAKDLDYLATDIPQEITEACLKMLNVLRLQFGAFDFAVDTKGDFYFFEVNPNGQWHWLEDRAGVLISDAIVDILKLGRR